MVELLPLRIGVGDNEGEIGGVGFDEDMFEIFIQMCDDKRKFFLKTRSRIIFISKHLSNVFK